MSFICRWYSSSVTIASMRRRDYCVDSSSSPKKMMIPYFSEEAALVEVEGPEERRLWRQDTNPEGDPKPSRRTMTSGWCDVVWTASERRGSERL